MNSIVSFHQQIVLVHGSLTISVFEPFPVERVRDKTNKQTKKEDEDWVWREKKEVRKEEEELKRKWGRSRGIEKGFEWTSNVSHSVWSTVGAERDRRRSGSRSRAALTLVRKCCSSHHKEKLFSAAVCLFFCSQILSNLIFLPAWPELSRLSWHLTCFFV